MTEVEWRISDGLVGYADALAFMEARAKAIRDDGAPECVWLLEHPPLYTAGTSAQREDLRDPDRFDVFETGRGGEYTYHGPGQRIVYLMLDLDRRGRDVRQFVRNLEGWAIASLAEFGVVGERRSDRPGVWVRRQDLNLPTREDKIAALGVRVRRWVTLHGMALNVEPDLSHYDGIVPCGISGHGVTSLADLGLTFSMTDVDIALRGSFERCFPNA